MRTISVLMVCITAITACHKNTPADVTKSCALPPANVVFVVLDQDGNSLITSKADKVSITYDDHGVTKTTLSVIGKLATSLTDTTTSPKYNGLAIGSEISSYSVRNENPVKNFELSINDKKLGTIYFDIEKTDWAHGCYIPKSFLFNEDSVTADVTVIPFVSVLQVR